MRPIDHIDSVLDLLALPTTAFVQTSYRILLGRSPDQAELQARAGGLRAGQNRRRVIADIVNSAEFKMGQKRFLAEGSDEAFVSSLYRMFLNRTPDSSGMATYLRFLRKGKSRNALRLEIATSPEAKVTSSFWFELELMLADERQAKTIFGRWLGHGRRLQRRRNQEWEITCRDSPTGDGSGRAGSERKPDGLHRQFQSSVRVAHSVALAQVNPTILPSATKRILARLQHFSGGDAHSRDLS